jgi:hypothetical protein
VANARQRDEEMPPPTVGELIVFSLWRFVLGVLCRTGDLVLLLLRPRLLRPYLALWAAEKVDSPYRWPRSFDAALALRQSGQERRELLYGEGPLCTAVWLLWRAGVSAGSHVLDLGAGRGRVLLAARWLGAKASGLELRADHVARASPLLAHAGAQLTVGDAMRADLTGITHVFLNWCAFSDATQRRIAERLMTGAESLRVIAVTQPVPGFEVRARLFGLFTWGPERAFLCTRARARSSARSQQTDAVETEALKPR